MKVCKICGEKLSSSEFYRNSGMKFGLRNECKSCFYKLSKQKVNKESKWDDVFHGRKISIFKSRLKLKYGISLEDYNKLFEQQGGRCMICLKHETSLNEYLAVDHCHATGKIRGLLCGNCNKALGLFRDNVEILQSAISYLTWT